MNPSNSSNSSNPSILLTIDVEDWFQVENFKKYIPFSSWPNCELRVEKNTHHILNLLDSHSAQHRGQRAQRIKDNGPRTTDNRPDEKVHATFFVLGWIAERLPHLVKEIHSRGHEVASHGYRHNLCTDCSSEDLKTDLVESKKRLEDTIGAPVFGYRAPSFSINDDILKIIEECGYLYDSSYNSFGMHARYGHLDLSRNRARGIAIQMADHQTQNPEPLPREIHDSDSEAYLTGAEPRTQNPEPRTFYELPISNINLLKSVLPWGGGGYFRLIPFPLFKIGIKFVLGQQNAYLFYFHPWEIDPEQPKVDDAPFFYKFRHYINLSKTASKLSSFIEAFKDCNFITCYQYLQEMAKDNHNAASDEH